MKNKMKSFLIGMTVLSLGTLSLKMINVDAEEVNTNNGVFIFLIGMLHKYHLKVKHCWYV